MVHLITNMPMEKGVIGFKNFIKVSNNNHLRKVLYIYYVWLPLTPMEGSLLFSYNYLRKSIAGDSIESSVGSGFSS